jgi:hypothetical protein
MLKILSTSVLALMFTSSPAFAINPCHHINLKYLVCQIVDSAHSTSAEIRISRDVTSGGSAPSCTTGVIQESMVVYPSFMADTGKRADLLFDSSHNGKLLSTLEQGQSATAVLYSAGLELQDLQAHLSFTPESGVITANLSLQARIIQIYSANQASVTINGTAVCTEVH